MKTWKRMLSMLLAPVLLVCMLSLPCSAAAGEESDIVQRTGWHTAKYYAYSKVYEIVLHPRFVTCADVRITDGRQIALEEDAAFTVRRREVGAHGLCYILTVATNGAAVYLQPDSFLDEEGNGNAKLYLTNDAYLTSQCAVLTDFDFSAGVNVMEQGAATAVTFRTSGTVTLGGRTLAEDVQAYTLTYADTGEYTLALSVNGLAVASYKVCVKTAAQIREDRIAFLEKERAETTKAFFQCLPLALLTLPLAPLAIFGFLWPFAPIEIAGQYFDIVSELRRLKAQR